MKRLVLEDLNHKLKTETDGLQKNIEGVSYLEHLCVHEIEKLMPSVADSVRKVKTLTRGDIYELKGLEEPSSSILLVMESVLLILKFEPKPSESSWDAVKRMISERAFISNTSDAISETHCISQVSLHTIERIQKNDAYSIPELYNHAATILRDWSTVVTKLYQVRHSLIPKRKLLHDTIAKVQIREEHIKDLQQEIQTHEIESISLKQHFQALAKRNEIYAFRIKEVEIKLSISQGIRRSLHELKEKLSERHLVLEESFKTLTSSCIIAACAVCLLGCYSSDLRKELINRWKHGLCNFNMAELPPSYKISEVMGSKTSTDPLEVDLFVHETLLMAKNHPKVPIIMDDFAKTIETIKTVEKDPLVVVIKNPGDEYIEKIKMAISDGSSLVFLISPSTPFKSIQQIARTAKVLIPMETTSPNFKNPKLYIVVTAGELQNLWPKSDWASDFAPFKISYCYKASQPKITDAICATHNIYLRQKLASKRNEISQSIAKRDMLLNRVIEFACKLVENDIYGGELYKTMIDIQSQLEAACFKVKHSEKSFNTIFAEFSSYEIVGSALAQIYGVFYEMKSISPIYMVDIEDFLEVCRKKVSSLSIALNTEDLKKYCEEVCKTLFYLFVPGYKQTDRLVFLFFLSLTIGKIELFGKNNIWKLSPMNIRFLIYGLADPSQKKPFTVKNTCKAWLSDSKWENILELSKMPHFSQFAVEFAKYGNKATTPVTETSWQEIHEARDPLKSEFPQKWSMQLSRLEKMMVIRALRPDSLFNIVEEICKSLLGHSFLDSAYPVDILSQRFSMSTTFTPILLFNQSTEDELFAINQLAAQFQLEPPCISTPSVLEKEMQEVLPRISGKGTWLVINFQNEGEMDYSNFFCNIQECIRAQSGISNNFRLWILFPALISGLPPKVQIKSVKLFLEEEVEFRNIFYASFMILGLKADQIKLTKDYYLRKTLFNLCVFFAVIKYRMRSYPLVIDNFIDMQYSDLKLAFSLFFELFEKNPHQVSVSKQMLFMNVFERVWGSRIPKTANQTWFVRLFDEIINITWPHTEDDPEKSNYLPPLGVVYDRFCADDFKSANEKIGQLPRGLNLKVHTFGHSENITMILEGQKSYSLLGGISLMRPEILNNLSTTSLNYDTVIKILTQLKSKILNETHFSWYLGTDVKTNRLAPSRGERTPSKSLENLSKQNFIKYRNMTKEIIGSLNAILMQLSGIDIADPTTIHFASQVIKNELPTKWRDNDTFYKSQLSFHNWTCDFISRLHFIRDWYTCKYESKATESFIFIDFSKLFSPEDLIPCVLMEASQQMNEPIENLELETIFISERQKNIPERGCYVTGLYLYGASFDSHKNALRSPKPSEICCKFPWVSDINLDMVFTKS
jgi:dynein heavy chain, axonemal